MMHPRTENHQEQVIQPARVVRRVGPGGAVVQAVRRRTAPTAPAAQPDPFDRELRGFQRDVTLCDWPAVKTFLSRLEKDEGKAAYEHLLEALASGQFGGQGMMPGEVQMMNRGMRSRCKCKCSLSSS